MVRYYGEWCTKDVRSDMKKIIRFVHNGYRYGIPTGLAKNVWMEMSCNPNITMKELSKITGVCLSTIFACIILLRMFGYIEREGTSHAVRVRIPLYPSYNGVVKGGKRDE